MLAVATLLVVLLLSVLVTRIASVALVHTGLGEEAARFQARSAFTGTGFTTAETEAIVSHPLRRRIVGHLMLAGNVGIVTAVSSLLVSMWSFEAGGWQRPAALAVGLLALCGFATSRWVDGWLCAAIRWGLMRFSDIDLRDYARVLHLRDDYSIHELRITSDDWICERTLGELKLEDEGVRVLAVACPGGGFLGAPPSDTELQAGDQLVIYGRASRIAELEQRPVGASGDERHAAARREQDERTAMERERAGR
ncbi:MAG: TrkA C-terminal domain-containing protein [Myxococcota bacterium]